MEKLLHIFPNQVHLYVHLISSPFMENSRLPRRLRDNIHLNKRFATSVDSQADSVNRDGPFLGAHWVF